MFSSIPKNEVVIISNYHILQHHIESLNKELAQPKFIQKIYSSSRYLSIQLHGGGQGFYLYLGRGHGFEGCWQAPQPIPSALRLKDQFLEYLRKYLSGGLLLSVQIDNWDRIMILNYQKFGQKNTFYLFWCARNLYVAHDYFDPAKDAFVRWLSWEGRVEYDHPGGMLEHFNKIGRTQLIVNSSVIKTKTIDELLKDELQNISENPVQRKSHKKLMLKVENIKNDITQMDLAIRYQEELIHLDPSELEELKEFKIGNLKHKFKKEMNSYQKKDDLFLWIKRLKVIREKQLSRLVEVEELSLKKTQTTENINDRKVISPIWKTSVSSKGSAPAISKQDQNYSIVSFDLYKIGYGHDAKGNDSLRREWAKDADTWVHLDGRKSSHAIIKSSNQQNCEIPWIFEAAKILAKLSGITEGDINIIYTQVKHLKSVAGNPGMVNYKKEKRLRFII
jgi:predicted ribosome quality control (RQC) complex YloA/Tae2 family protein